MRSKQRQSGMTLTELLVVVAIMAVLLGISVPTAQHLKESFESSTSVRHLINAALGNARAMAVRGEKGTDDGYAGIRFQQDTDGNSYMIFIICDSDPSPDGTDLANGFRTTVGRKPMKLPEDVGILANIFPAGYTDAQNDALLDMPVELTDASTFSIVFAKAGKLTIHLVRTRNKDGYSDGRPEVSNDTIFNKKDVVDELYLPLTSMFYQDDYPALGLDQENSVQSIIVYSKKELQAVPADKRWSDYLKNINADYISPYTGELIFE